MSRSRLSGGLLCRGIGQKYFVCDPGRVCRELRLIHINAFHFALRERDGEVHTGEQGGGVHPVGAAIGIAGGFEFPVEGLAKLGHELIELRGVVDVAVNGTDGAGDHFERRLHFGTEVRWVPEFGGGNHGPHDFAQIAIG